MSEITIHAASWLVNPNEMPVAGGAIAVKNGIVIARGTCDELLRTVGGTVVDYSGYAIIPGFVNAHTHLELTHFPAWREQNGMGYSPRSFVDWIIQVIKINRGVTAEQLQASLKEGLRKCLQSGTTVVGDVLSRYQLLPLYADSPMGGRLYLELLGHETAQFITRLEQAQAAAAALETLQCRMHPAFSPHAPYTIAEAHLPMIREAALTSRLPLAIHIAESAAETEFMFDSTGLIAETMYPFVHWQQHLVPARRCSSTDFFDRNGLLSSAAMAVHCVHLSSADARILKERGVTVCLCPRSNERLDVGSAPVALFKKLEIPLALGTDSLASNDSLSIWDEMRFALDHYHGTLSPDELFAMATIGGARGLSLADQTGSLTVGKHADFQLVPVADVVTADRIVASMIERGGTEALFIGGGICEL